MNSRIIKEDCDAKCNTMAILLKENYKRFTTSSADINSRLTNTQTNNQDNSPEYPNDLESIRVVNDDGDAEINAVVRYSKENYQKTTTSTMSDIQPRLTADNTQTKNKNKLYRCPVDVESMKDKQWRTNLGGFSFELIEGFRMPYIVRLINGENLKFVSIQMAETHLFNNYLKYLSEDITRACVSMVLHCITVNEAKLFNYIKSNYEKLVSRKKTFIAGMDYIVRLEDVREFYTFIKICHNTLLGKKQGRRGKFGFIRIASSSIIPYYMKNNQKFVPVCCLNGLRENLENEYLIIEKWDLAYLKFCFLIQGISKDAYAFDSCSLISLDRIKIYYPPKTYFEDFWPHTTCYSHRLIRRKNKSSTRPNRSYASATHQAVNTTNQPVDTIGHPLQAPAPVTTAIYENETPDIHMSELRPIHDYGQ